MSASQEDKTGAPEKKQSGGQPGNQNARKGTGLYVRHMSKRQQERFEEAKRVTGLKEEISVVRSLLDWAIGEYPEDYRLHMKLIRLLAQVDAVQERLEGPEVRKRNEIIRKARELVGPWPRTIPEKSGPGALSGDI